LFFFVSDVISEVVFFWGGKPHNRDRSRVFR